jgi:predicted nucleic acid-binding protein
VITAIDSNIVIGLWNEDKDFSLEAARALELASGRGELVICAPVYVEIRALPGRSEGRVDDFLRRGGIGVEWELEESIWREAARASHAYSLRRDTRAKPPRRIAADFVIGAHAALRGYSLLTLDRRTFRVSFPTLRFAPESS